MSARDVPSDPNGNDNHPVVPGSQKPAVSSPESVQREQGSDGELKRYDPHFGPEYFPASQEPGAARPKEQGKCGFCEGELELVQRCSRCGFMPASRETPVAPERNTLEGQMELYRKALESARTAFNEILTIHWGWDGDCGALTYANDGFDICDEALKASPVPEQSKSDDARRVS